MKNPEPWKMQLRDAIDQHGCLVKPLHFEPQVPLGKFIKEVKLIEKERKSKG